MLIFSFIMAQTIAIIGAGVTGLGAAYRIRQESPDSRLLVFERDEMIGGMAKTLEWEGCRLDLGPHRFYTEIAGIEPFVRKLCSNCFVPVRRRSRMRLRNKLIRYPVSPLEVVNVLGVGSSFGIAWSSIRHLVSGKQSSVITYNDYICNRFGDRLYELLFGPYARKVWGCDPSDLEAETAIVRLRGDTIWQSLLDAVRGKGSSFVSTFLYPTGGIGQISRNLAACLKESELILNTGEVFPVVENGKCTGVRNRQGESWKTDTVLSTIPLPDLTRSVFDPESSVCLSAKALTFRGLVLLFLLYEKDLAIRDTWLYFPEPEIPFTRLSVPKNFHPDNVPSGKTVICLEFPCEPGDTIYQAGESELRSIADEYLRRIGLADCSATAGLVVRLREGYPVYRVGYRSHFNSIISALKTIPNLITAGRQGLFRHNNMDQAIQMGLIAGEQIVRSPNGSTEWYDGLSRFEGYRIVD